MKMNWIKLYRDHDKVQGKLLSRCYIFGKFKILFQRFRGTICRLPPGIIIIIIIIIIHVWKINVSSLEMKWKFFICRRIDEGIEKQMQKFQKVEEMKINCLRKLCENSI